MEHNDLVYLGYRIDCDLKEFIELLVAQNKIEKHSCEYLKLKELITVVNRFAGFTKENEDGS